MKIIIIILCFLPLKSFANFEINCHSINYLQKVTIEKSNSELIITYINNEGKNTFPLFEGTVTAQNFSQIKKAKKELAQINEKLRLVWKIEQCDNDLMNPMIISCNGESTITHPANLKVKSTNFYTSNVSEQTPNFTYHQFKVRIGLQNENIKNISTIAFDPNHCETTQNDFLNK
jgi:hypothetical protein